MVLTSSYHKMELPKYKLWNDPHLCLYFENVPLNVRYPCGLFACNTKCHQNFLGIILRFGRLTTSQLLHIVGR